jgi:hypothetical protein
MAGTLNKKEFTMRLQKLLKHSAEKSREGGRRGSSAKAVRCLTKQLHKCEEEADLFPDMKPARVNSYQVFSKAMRLKKGDRATPTYISDKWRKMSDESKEKFALKAVKLNKPLRDWKIDNSPKKKEPSAYNRFTSAMTKYRGFKVTEMKQPWKEFKETHGPDKETQMREIEKIVKQGIMEQEEEEEKEAEGLYEGEEGEEEKEAEGLYEEE